MEVRHGDFLLTLRTAYGASGRLCHYCSYVVVAPRMDPYDRSFLPTQAVQVP